MKVYFSIIVPVYNASKYLDLCINSVINQNFENYEIILINDGSTDNSLDICKKYKNQYSNIIKIIDKENGGQLSARIAGIKNACGKYAVFLDSDDCLNSGALRVLYEIYNKYFIDMVLYKWKRVDSEGKRIEEKEYKYFKEGFLDKSKLIYRLLTTSRFNSMCIKSIKLDILKRCFYDKIDYKVRHGEDLIQTFELLRYVNNIYFCDKTLYLYRKNANSVTRTFNKYKYKNINIVFDKRYKYLKDYKHINKELEIEFFSFYLSSIWEDIFRAVRNGVGIKDIKVMFKEISSWSLLKEIDKNVLKLPLRIDKKIGIYLFVNYYWNIEFLYAKFLSKIFVIYLLLKK